MFTRKYRQMNADLQQQLAAERLHMAALDRSMARVEFDPDGNITDANENFLTLLGYRRDEILGKPHRQLCDGAYAQSEDYRRFWERLRRGEHFSGRCKRIYPRGPATLAGSHLQPRTRRAGSTAQGGQVRQRHRCHRPPGTRDAEQAGCPVPLDGDDRVRPRRQCPRGQRQLPRHHGLWPSRAGQRQPPSVLRTGLPRRPAVRRPLAPPEPRRVRHRAVPPGPPQRPAGLAGSQLQPGLRRRRQALQGGQVRQRCQRPHAPLPGRGGQRPPGPYPVHRDPHGRRTRRADHPERGGGNAQDREYPGCFLAEHRRTVTALATDHLDRQHHPRDRRADQPARPQCRHRGRPRRRPGSRLRRGGRRGAATGGTHQQVDQGDRRHDRSHPDRHPQRHRRHAAQPGTERGAAWSWPTRPARRSSASARARTRW